MVSQKVFDFCQGKTTISSELARDPTLAPGHVAKKLYGTDVADHAEAKHFKEPRATAEDLEKAYQCGKWGSTRPSEQFLRVSQLRGPSAQRTIRLIMVHTVDLP